jgi:hypothetical protein
VEFELELLGGSVGDGRNSVEDKVGVTKSP